MKVRLLLGLFLAGLLCDCATTDTNTQTQQTVLSPTPPQPAAPLTPQVGDRH